MNSYRPGSSLLLVFLIAMLFMSCSSYALSPTEVAERAQRAVVTIATESGFGSGVLIDNAGIILTCYHVYDGSVPAAVKTFDGQVYEAKGLLDSDPEQDIAVTKIELPASVKLTYLPIGDSSKVKLGEEVIAVGNPRGFERTVSKGNISGIRKVSDCPPDFRTALIQKGYGHDDTLIQFTAPVSPGSSGGPVVNMQGEVVGICIMGRMDADNIYFAVPVNDAKRCLGAASVVTPVASNPVKVAAGSGGGASGGIDAATLAIAVLLLLAVLVIILVLVLVMRKRGREEYVADDSGGYVQVVSTGISLPVTVTPINIGRSPDNDLVLDSPEVSRKHASIVQIGGNSVIDDLGSKSGVYVNGEKFRRKVLSDGDIVKIGTVELCFHAN